MFERNGISHYVNSFWTSRQRQSKRIHEISYRACFKAELPEFFIGGLTSPGDGVFDPFMGRGTTVIQAALMGRKAYGNDVNPLCRMLVAPRLDIPSLSELAVRLERIPAGSCVPEDSDLLAFYHPETLRRICSLRDWFIGKVAQGGLDRVDEWIRMVALNRLTGHSSGFFSIYTMPPNQAVSAERQRILNRKRGLVPPQRDVDALVMKKSRSLLSQNPGLGSWQAEVGTHPSDDARNIPARKIDLIVTSPPFLDVVDYVGDNWLRLWFAGIDPDEVSISSHNSPEDWIAFVRRSFGEFARVLRSGAFVAFEVGEVRSGKVLLETLVARAVEGLPFRIRGVVVNDQKFTKTAHCWGVSNNSKGTNSNRIVVAQRL